MRALNHPSSSTNYVELDSRLLYFNENSRRSTAAKISAHTSNDLQFSGFKISSNFQFRLQTRDYA
jgi:lipoate-protein ligase A